MATAVTQTFLKCYVVCTLPVLHFLSPISGCNFTFYATLGLYPYGNTASSDLSQSCCTTWTITVLLIGHSGPCSIVGIVTGYGLDSPGIEYWWGQDFPHLSRLALGPTQPPVQWVPGLSRGWRAAEVLCWPLTPFQCRCHERDGAIPLLPLWAAWPVQSLSACTRVHFTVLIGHNAIISYAVTWQYLFIHWALYQCQQLTINE